MTKEQRDAIVKLRGKGYGYGWIADSLGISVNTVKSFCRRNHLNEILPADGVKTNLTLDEDAHFCQCCGKPVVQVRGRKRKKFCSDKCRMTWWNSHLDKVNRKANYEFVCQHCKKPFTVYGNANRKYCSHECYIADRFGGVD